MYFVYILRCEDNSLYTGITNNLEKRMNEHFSKSKECAKYTKSHKAQKVEAIWKTENKSLASKLEFHIKKDLNKMQKEILISDNKKLQDFFNEDIINSEKYVRILNTNEKDNE